MDRVPVDLIVVLFWTITTVAASLLPVINETVIRAVLGVPFIIFLPGYATVAVLFPEAGENPKEDGRNGDGHQQYKSKLRGGINGIERAALSLGLSVAISSLLIILLNMTPWGIQLVPVLVAIGGFTLITAAVAVRRRQNLNPNDQFRVPFQSYIATIRAGLFKPDTTTDAFLNGLVIVSLLLATVSIGYAFTAPWEGDSFSELYVLTETSDGELVTDGYPREFQQGEAQPIVIGVKNYEYERTKYTIRIAIQEVEFTGPNETQIRVNNAEELGRFQTTVDHNQTDHEKVQLRPTVAGEHLRITFLLYRGSVPSEPSLKNAHRSNQLWVNVTSS